MNMSNNDHRQDINTETPKGLVHSMQSYLQLCYLDQNVVSLALQCEHKEHYCNKATTLLFRSEVTCIFKGDASCFTTAMLVLHCTKQYDIIVHFLILATKQCLMPYDDNRCGRCSHPKAWSSCCDTDDSFQY
jgi:hypothetical protein